VQLLVGDGQSELRETEEQGTKRELSFHARQRGAEAEVDAVSERDVVRVAAFEVERLESTAHASGSMPPNNDDLRTGGDRRRDSTGSVAYRKVACGTGES
jgi:hypothetical protein